MLLIRGNYADEARIFQVLLQFLLVLFLLIESLFGFRQDFLNSSKSFRRSNVWSKVYLGHRISWLILQFDILLGLKRW